MENLATPSGSLSRRSMIDFGRTVAAFGGDVLTFLPEDDNQFFSPLSIHAVLTALAAVARGDTRYQLGNALGLIDGVDAAVDLYAATLPKVLWAGDPPTPGYKLSVDSSVWLAAGRPWRMSEMAPLFRKMSVAPAEGDFSNPEGVCRAVNEWAGRVTDGLITALLAPGDVDAETLMILATAVHFKAAWMTEFDPADTHSRPFTTASGGQTRAAFMQQEGSVLYAETEHAQAVCLPYAGGRVAMNIVLPREGLEDAIDGRRLAASLAVQKVRLLIPRFTLRARYDLIPVLQALGVEDAFDDRRANFALLDGVRDRQLKVGKVVHEAVVEVTEDGTEAAAVTAVAMMRGLSVDRPKIFLADRPFTFTINHVPSGTVLFAGRCGRP